MSTHDHAAGEVHSLEHYGKFKLFESSTAHAGMEEIQISCKEHHKAHLEAYQLRRASMDVELEAQTKRACRNFKKLLQILKSCLYRCLSNSVQKQNMNT